MNAPTSAAAIAPVGAIDPAEWTLRVELAAAYRIADHLGWSELIYTHISLRVPGPEHHFLINPYGLRFDEVTASNLVKIDADGRTVGAGAYKANEAGFVIHSAVHLARADAQCVFHTHTLAGMAVSAQAGGLLPIHMYSHNFYGRVAYHDFEGPSMNLGERERLVASLGSQPALILRNHGLLTVGRTVARGVHPHVAARARVPGTDRRSSGRTSPRAEPGGLRAVGRDGRRLPHRPRRAAARAARVRRPGAGDRSQGSFLQKLKPGS